MKIVKPIKIGLVAGFLGFLINILFLFSMYRLGVNSRQAIILSFIFVLPIIILLVHIVDKAEIIKA